MSAQQGAGTRGKSQKSDERQELINALQAAEGNKSEAARRLGVSRVTLWKRIKKYDIQFDQQIRN
jgi:transcriptional regulator of acetoin/glycerol metabolism